MMKTLFAAAILLIFSGCYQTGYQPSYIISQEVENSEGSPPLPKEKV